MLIKLKKRVVIATHLFNIQEKNIFDSLYKFVIECNCNWPKQIIMWHINEGGEECHGNPKDRNFTN